MEKKRTRGGCRIRKRGDLASGWGRSPRALDLVAPRSRKIQRQRR